MSNNKLKSLALVAVFLLGMQDAMGACPMRGAYTKGSSPVVGGWQELGSYALAPNRYSAPNTYPAQGSAFGEVCGGTSVGGYTGCTFYNFGDGGGWWQCSANYTTITYNYSCPSNTAMIPVVNYRRADGVLLSGTFTACVATDTY